MLLEQVNIQNTASSQKSEEQILGQNSSEYDDTKKQLVDYVQHMEVATSAVKKIVLHELRKADYVQHTEVAIK
ncbi:unnamed protein product, partial [Timema podura]|nr:unnamed protein product [Timema podura]